MKKLFIPAVTALLSIFNAAQAQTNNSGYVLNTTKEPKTETRASARADRGVSGVNEKAFKSFSGMYKGFTQMGWSQLKDKSILFRFYENGILNRAFYSSNGTWLHTVSSYEEAQLPKNIRGMVNGRYYDFKITFVNEVLSPDTKPVYLVQLQDAKKILIVKMNEEEIEEVQEFQN